MDDVNAAREWDSILIEDRGGTPYVMLLRASFLRDCAPDGDEVLKGMPFFAGEAVDLINRLVDLVLEDEEEE
jgi:hypothetical protein